MTLKCAKYIYLIQKKLGLIKSTRQKGVGNIFHCCVHKTSSQWIKDIFSDPIVCTYTQLSHHHYQSHLAGGADNRKIHQRSFDKPFPRNTVVSPLYIDFDNFQQLQKPYDYRAFFVMRDPRDIVVSWYFSCRYSHATVGDMLRIRHILSSRNVADGLLYSIEWLADFGLFHAIKSWHESATGNPNIVIVRFEDLTATDNLPAMKNLFRHCSISIPSAVLSNILNKHSFKRKSGHEKGEEHKYSHYRKGISGDWKNYFNDTVLKKFTSITGQLVHELGYQ